MSLRDLDIDDLYLMRYLAQGHNVTYAAAQLNLTAPAISQRTRKLEKALDIMVIDRNYRKTAVTGRALTLCDVADLALSLLEEFVSDQKKQLVGVKKPEEPAMPIPPRPKTPKKPKTHRLPRSSNVPKFLNLSDNRE